MQFADSALDMTTLKSALYACSSDSFVAGETLELLAAVHVATASQSFRGFHFGLSAATSAIVRPASTITCVKSSDQ